ncbi:hypothetical protein UA70_26995 [Raoultella planticola]|nr:hypothetical protein UA70_26995 [Raoultella planticola]
MLLGLIFVLAMTRVYQIETVPTWYSGGTTTSFFLTMALTGPLFAALLLRAANVEFNGRFRLLERAGAVCQHRSGDYAGR